MKKLPILIASLFFLLVLIQMSLAICGQRSLRGQVAVEQRLREIASSTGEFDSSETTAVFNNQLLTAPRQEIAYQPEPQVLSATSNEEKWIEISLSEQKLLAHESDQIIYEFPISSGKPWTPTVTGEFRIWSKFKYTKMSGGSRALGTYYYLPNVPFTMYFHGDYGIHGTYWHNNFGHPMSHGCVNMRTPDVEKLFYWAQPKLASSQRSARATSNNPGTRVIVHGATPRE